MNSEVLTAAELDEFLTQEDAPQVVGVLDERPLALRLDDYRKSSKWKLVGSDDEDATKSPKNSVENKSSSNECASFQDKRSPVGTRRRYDSDSDNSPPRFENSNNKERSSNIKIEFAQKRNKNFEPDFSPPRVRKNKVNSSPDRKQKSRTPEIKKERDSSPVRKRRQYSDSDASLERKTESGRDTSPKRYRKYSNSDMSPPRRRKEETPPRRQSQRSDSDTCPPKRTKLQETSSARQRRNFDVDNSPPRKNISEYDNPLTKAESDSDASPPRKYKNKSDMEFHSSRPKHEHTKKSRWGDRTPPRDKYSEQPEKSYDSYSRKQEKEERNTKISNAVSSSSQKMNKTLDGKTAGLQNAQDLKHETVAFKKREDELFKKMSEETSGINAAPIMRDRKTGKKRDFEKEAMAEFAKLKAQQERKDKYDLWGKGLKQVDDFKEKIASDLHEMNKPLARYADDEDLDKYLREQEREGDPMLAYIRKKRKKKDVEDGKPSNLFDYFKIMWEKITCDKITQE